MFDVGRHGAHGDHDAAAQPGAGREFFREAGLAAAGLRLEHKQREVAGADVAAPALAGAVPGAEGVRSCWPAPFPQAPAASASVATSAAARDVRRAAIVNSGGRRPEADGT